MPGNSGPGIFCIHIVGAGLVSAHIGFRRNIKTQRADTRSAPTGTNQIQNPGE